MIDLKKNDIYTVVIAGYSSEAYGVCRIDGRAVFVPRAIVGEMWEIRIVKVTASAVYARPERLIVPSPERRVPECPYFGRCGGCDTWHMSYDEELRFKLERVNDALEHIGRQSVHAEEIIGADCYERYRNKGIFAVAAVNGQPCAGFYRERSHELIPVDDCLIQDELCRRAASAVTAFMAVHGISAYDEANGKGTVRHIFCRRAIHTADAVVCIIAARGFGAATGALVDTLRKGMDARAVAAVAAMQPQRVVYVSCNPATLARDVLRFAGLGYELKAVTAVDMFPRTCHVETVCLLS